MEALLTVKEAAEITRLKPKTLYAYAERRIIPHIKLGSRLFLPERNLRDGLKAILLKASISGRFSNENSLPDNWEDKAGCEIP